MIMMIHARRGRHGRGSCRRTHERTGTHASLPAPAAPAHARTHAARAHTHTIEIFIQVARQRCRGRRLGSGRRRTRSLAGPGPTRTDSVTPVLSGPGVQNGLRQRLPLAVSASLTAPGPVQILPLQLTFSRSLRAATVTALTMYTIVYHVKMTPTLHSSESENS
jgi:hypothetical protein